MSIPGTPFVDSRQVRRNFARAATGYDAVSVLQREIASRMLERLDYVKIEPQCVLDVGCGTGGSLTALSERYRGARIIGADASEAMLRAGLGQRSRLRWMLPFLRGNRSASLLAAEAQALPFRTGAAGLVWSNFMLHWLDDPIPAFREMHRVLEVGGLLMFATLGPDTLKELRACFSDGYEHTQRFIDMHDYGDMLMECGFADPVMDAERMTMTYPSLDALFGELQRNGAGCAMQGRRRGLTGRAAWRSVCDAYGRFAIDGRFPATFEVIYGHAWKLPPQKTEDGRAIIHFERRQHRR